MATENLAAPLVGVVMGSKSDWETMRHASELLTELGIPHETKVVSAHRTPERLFRYGREAEGRGLEVLIAGAGGAAHLPGMLAAITICQYWACRWKARCCAGSTRYYRSCRCRVAFRSARWPSAARARPTRRFWPRRSWVGSIRAIREALARFRQAQTDAVGESPS